MRGKSTDDALARDILEWNVPEEVLAVLLQDHSTGRNLIWATDDHAARGKGFGALLNQSQIEFPMIQFVTCQVTNCLETIARRYLMKFGQWHWMNWIGLHESIMYGGGAR